MSRQERAAAREEFVRQHAAAGNDLRQIMALASEAWGIVATAGMIHGIAFRGSIKIPGAGRAIPAKGADKLAPIHGSVKQVTRWHLERLAEARSLPLSQIVGELLDEFAADDFAANGQPGAEARP